jgi:uncharacterized protein YfiM (DUF2279 family)
MMFAPALFGASGLKGEAGNSSDPWLARDKLAHFSASLAVVGLSHHLMSCESGFPAARSRGHAAGLAISLGLVKEVKDKNKPGNFFSFRDLAADLLGTGIGLLLFTLND